MHTTLGYAYSTLETTYVYLEFSANRFFKEKFLLKKRNYIQANMVDKLLINKR